jgi:RTX calcium-binding nonapeptide repeat (4 copies)
VFRATLIACVAAGLGVATVATAQPQRHARPTFVASYDVVLTGGEDRSKHGDNQDSDPNNHVVVQSDDSYRGRGILSLKEESNGRLVPSSDSFHYLSATWHLSGQNGGNGSFDCNPPLTTTDGTVDAAGWVAGGVPYLRFLLDGTHEHNDDYDCGAKFTGFLSDTTYEADSLLQVEDAIPGRWVTGIGGTFSDTEDTGTSPNTGHVAATWSFTVTKRSGKDTSGPGPATAPKPTTSTRHVCTINGTPRNDVLTGGPGDDVICGYGGNDRITGGGGNDLIYGGPGKDRINARDGQLDRVDGGRGNDSGTFDKAPRDRVARVEHAKFR